MPEVLPGLRAEVWDTTELADRYARFGERFRRSFIRAEGYPYRGSQPHHLLGEPFSIQDDVRLTAAIVAEDEDAARTWGIAPDPALGQREAWRTLLALHWDDRIGLEIGDGGALHVLVPVSDVSANRLDRLVCDVSSG